MKLHHLTLKAAVAKYQSLMEGKTEQEVKAEISADTKGFDEENVNEIYEAIVNPKVSDDTKEPKANTKNEKPKAHIVSSSFRDAGNFNKEWKVGSDVSHFDQERLKKLVDLNLVTVK